MPKFLAHLALLILALLLWPHGGGAPSQTGAPPLHETAVWPVDAGAVCDASSRVHLFRESPGRLSADYSVTPGGWASIWISLPEPPHGEVVEAVSLTVDGQASQGLLLELSAADSARFLAGGASARDSGSIVPGQPSRLVIPLTAFTYRQDFQEVGPLMGWLRHDQSRPRQPLKTLSVLAPSNIASFGNVTISDLKLQSR